jgi:DNA-binding HxlR family transcriptional regulator
MAHDDSALPHTDAFCSIERTLEIVGERWTFLILREVLIYGKTRFGDFQAALGIAPNVLTRRLHAAVAAGILERRTYKVAGARTRPSYHATTKGTELTVVLAALQQWGDTWAPPGGGPTLAMRSTTTGAPLRVGFINDRDESEDLRDVRFERTHNWAAAAKSMEHAKRSRQQPDAPDRADGDDERS